MFRHDKAQDVRISWFSHLIHMALIAVCPSLSASFPIFRMSCSLECFTANRYAAFNCLLSTYD